MVRQLHRAFSLVLVLALLVGQVTPVAAQDDAPATEAGPPIRVGSGLSSEQQLLGTMISLLLQEAGYAVEDFTALGESEAVRAALTAGQIDLYPEYTGIALTDYNSLPTDALPNAANRSYELAKSLDAANDLVWLGTAPFNSSPALLARRDLALEVDGELLDDLDALATYMNGDNEPLTICVDGEFYGSDDGLVGLQSFYGFTWPEGDILLMDADEAYQNLVEGDCDIAQGTATDGRIAAWDLQVLDDPEGFFHFYQPAPVAQAALVEQYPNLAAVLDPVMARLDRTAMTILNARVTVGADGLVDSGDEEAVADVALNFLMANGLIKPPAIRIGSKEFTEQLLLGKLLVLLLRDAGYEVEDMTGMGGTTQIRQAIEADEIDIYPEYTGTATSVHHGIPVTALPTTAQRAYALARSLDAPAGLTWLEPMSFNNTYTLMVTQDLVDQGISTIDELAVYMNANDAPLTICIETEFYARPDGLDGLQALYGFAFTEENIFVVEASETYLKLRNGECDVAEGFATDGRINAWGLINLEDTLAFFPFYNPAPVVRKEVLDLNPELAGLINQLSRLLDGNVMSELNARVDIGPDGRLASGDEESLEDVAYSFLRANRLVALPEIAVSVANPEDAHHTVIAEMLMLLLGDVGYQVVDKTELGGGLVVRQAILNGDVDLYVESVVTALTEYHNLPMTALPTTADRAYALAQTLDEPNAIRWLDRMSYNETYGIITSEALAAEQIESLDDFALYMIANDAPATICMDNEFYASTFNGLQALETLYGFTFKPENILLMDGDDIYNSLAEGECTVAAASNLDALARGYTVLADPLEFFLNFGSAPIIRGEILEQNPDLMPLIQSLTNLLDDETAGELDQRIELGPDGEEDSGDEQSAAAVAVDFLVANGLIAPPAEESEEADTPAETTTNDADDPSTTDGQTSAEDATSDDAAGEDASGEGTGEAEPTEEGATGANSNGAESPTFAQANPEIAGTTTVALEGPLIAVPLPVDRQNTYVAAQPSSRQSNDQIVIGAMADTEQQLLAKMMTLMLVDGNYPVADTPVIGTSPDLRTMLRNGEIDLYPEFTGAALSLFHSIPLAALPTTADGAFSLAQSLDEAFNIVWFRKASFDSAYGLAVSPTLEAQEVRSLLDVANQMNAGGTTFRFCFDAEFADDPEMGLAALTELYEFPIDPAAITRMPLNEIYRALRDGSCDIGEVLQSDGRIAAWDLTVLADTLGAFPNFTPAPIATQQLRTAYPELEEYLGQLGPLLEPGVIRALNAAVDLGADQEPNTGDELPLEEVATSFLCANQLLQRCTATQVADGTPAPEVAVVAPIAELIPMTSSAAFTVVESAAEAPVADNATGADAPAITEPVATATESGDTTDTAEPVNTEVVTTESVSTESVNTGAENTTTNATELVATITVTTPETFGVNARSTANPAAPIVTVLPSNTAVEAIGRTADSSWLQVTLADGQLAWVYAAAVVSDLTVIQQLPVIDL